MIENKQLKRWRTSPFRLLVCMPFKEPEIAVKTWSSFIEPTLTSIGTVIRIDWVSKDWVRDLREVARESAFILMDLTGARPSVLRELRFMFDENIPVICYINRPPGIAHRIIPVSIIDPQMCKRSSGGGVDEEILSYPVYAVDYGKSKELYELCDYLKEKLIPFHDKDDPSIPYIGSDISQLPPEEREGFLLAQIPRSRIIGRDNYWEKAYQLFSISAIYRARILSWLTNSNLLLHTPENLWCREQFLMIVRKDVLSGNRLTPNEYSIIAQYRQTEPVEDISLWAVDIMWRNEDAKDLALAVQRGMPPVPPKLPKSHQADNRILVKLKMAPSGQISSLQASEWKFGFPNSGGTILNRIGKVAKSTLRPRFFNLDAVKPFPAHLEDRLGEIEDALDQIALKLSMFASNMIDIGWAAQDIETVVRTIVSMKVMQEVERLDLRTERAELYHQTLERYLGQIWNRDPKDFYLFEFSSSHYKSHFRGILPWLDIKENFMQLYAQVVVSLVKEFSKEMIFQQAMEWDLPPAQLWDGILLTRMNEGVPEQVMQQLWAKYVLPSAFFYWRFEMIFVDPTRVDRWAYVNTPDLDDRDH